jgi:hypothetical protein
MWIVVGGNAPVAMPGKNAALQSIVQVATVGVESATPQDQQPLQLLCQLRHFQLAVMVSETVSRPM